jgi:hypothetical protein
MSNSIVHHSRIAAPMTVQGLGCAKTPALAAHVEISLINCISESQIILHARGSMPCWRIVFSTFRGCMSFYTARVRSGKAHSEQILSALPLKPDIGWRGWHVRKVPITDICSAANRISYSITSSAIASSVFGMAMPNALAVLRLTTNSNLVGCTTGRSAGFSPLRMRPT